MIPRHGSETKQRRDIAALLAVTFLFPVLLCAAFLPTPTDDLREQINIGLTFPLYTWKNPPLQSWLAGLVALTGARDAWAYMIAAQVLNFVGLAYLVLIARRFIAPQAAAPVAIAFCLTVFASLAVPSTALNADQIQTPLWLGLLYHVLAAAEGDRWRDFIAAAFCAALALLAKYFSVLFMAAFGLALLLYPSTRVLLLRPKLYVAAGLALLLLSPHVAAMLGRWDQLGYGMEILQAQAGFGRRLGWLGDLAAGALYALPLFVALGALGLRGARPRFAAPQGEAARVIIATAGILVALLAALILFAGLRMRIRYGEPVMPLLLLAMVAVMRFERPALHAFARTALWVWAAMVVGVLVLVQVFVVGKQRDPADAAAAVIRTEWDGRYPCGPAYVLGQQHAAHAIGLYVGGGAIGASAEDFTRGHWVDRERLRERGAVIVETPESAAADPFSRHLPAAEGAFETLSLPYRRWWRGGEHVYLYRFLPPADCPGVTTP